MPALYLIDRPEPNAFATGRNASHAAVAVTTGILGIMDDRQLRGVLAHEISHITNRDMLVGTIAATIGGAISFLGNMALWSSMFGGGDDEGGVPMPLMLLSAILAPIAATIIQLSVSRSREYGADLSGAELTQDPEGLASALERSTPSTSELQAAARRHVPSRPTAGAAAGACRDGPPLHREPARRAAPGQPVQHPSAHRRARPPVAQLPRRVTSGRSAANREPLSPRPRAPPRGRDPSGRFSAYASLRRVARQPGAVTSPHGSHLLGRVPRRSSASSWRSTWASSTSDAHVVPTRGGARPGPPSGSRSRSSSASACSSGRARGRHRSGSRATSSSTPCRSTTCSCSRSCSAAFAVPRELQHRVLFWGVVGALVMRFVLILVGAHAHRELPLDHLRVRRVPGVHGHPDGCSAAARHETHPENNPIVRFARRHMRVVPDFQGQKFFIPTAVGPRRDAPAAGAHRGRDVRPHLRGRLHPGHLRGHHRPVHRVHQQRVRDPRPALAVLPAGGCGGPVPLPEAGPRRGAHLRGRQDAAHGHPPPRAGGVAADHPGAAGREHRGVAHRRPSRGPSTRHRRRRGAGPRLGRRALAPRGCRTQRSGSSFARPRHNEVAKRYGQMALVVCHEGALDDHGAGVVGTRQVVGAAVPDPRRLGGTRLDGHARLGDRHATGAGCAAPTGRPGGGAGSSPGRPKRGVSPSSTTEPATLSRRRRVRLMPSRQRLASLRSIDAVVDSRTRRWPPTITMAGWMRGDLPDRGLAPCPAAAIGGRRVRHLAGRLGDDPARANRGPSRPLERASPHERVRVADEDHPDAAPLADATREHRRRPLALVARRVGGGAVERRGQRRPQRARHRAPSWVLPSARSSSLASSCQSSTRSSSVSGSTWVGPEALLTRVREAGRRPGPPRHRGRRPGRCRRCAGRWSPSTTSNALRNRSRSRSLIAVGDPVAVGVRAPGSSPRRYSQRVSSPSVSGSSRSSMCRRHRCPRRAGRCSTGRARRRSAGRPRPDRRWPTGGRRDAHEGDDARAATHAADPRAMRRPRRAASALGIPGEDPTDPPDGRRAVRDDRLQVCRGSRSPGDSPMPPAMSLRRHVRRRAAGGDRGAHARLDLEVEHLERAHVVGGQLGGGEPGPQPLGARLVLLLERLPDHQVDGGSSVMPRVWVSTSRIALVTARR